MKQVRKRRVRVPRGLLPFKMRGGARPGAGRKAKGGVAGVAHRTRVEWKKRWPAHVTVKLRAGLPRLRRGPEYAALRGAFAAGCERFGFRLVHYAVLNDHVHMIVEAEDQAALCRGLQGLLIRMARALNRVWRRKGKVFADRYHDHVLRTPREVRNALRYVLANGHKHERQGCHVRVRGDVDVYTSGPWFDGWLESVTVHGGGGPPCTVATTWLLRVGWQSEGRLSVQERASA